jgi:hypothetical protein
MRRIALIPVMLLIAVPVALFADVQESLAKADTLHDQGRCLEARTLLLDALAGATAKEKAELYWRAARETLDLGDDAEDAKQPTGAVLKFFEEGEGYAKKGIEADPQNNLPYYWQSANIGRWGQVKGILDSLFKAGPMKDLLTKDLGLNAEHADAYFVLGQLYRELPGWPLSFGNADYGVSLGRKAIDLNAEQVKTGTEKVIQYNYYTELAKTLQKRNWPQDARVREQKAKSARFTSAKDPLERGGNYESLVTLAAMSDREEGKALVQQAIMELEKKTARTSGEDKDLQKARDVLKTF